jgi:hypothetical protein
MKTLADYTPEQLEQAISLKKQIAALEAQLARLSGRDDSIGKGRPTQITTSTRNVSPKKAKRTMSPEGRAKIATALKARWAKAKAKGKSRL